MRLRLVMSCHCSYWIREKVSFIGSTCRSGFWRNRILIGPQRVAAGFGGDVLSRVTSSHVLHRPELALGNNVCASLSSVRLVAIRQEKGELQPLLPSLHFLPPYPTSCCPYQQTPLWR